MTSPNVNCKPVVGLEFDNIEDAYQFWLAYSARVGFGVRKRYANKNKDGTISSCRFVCSKEGLRKIKINALVKIPRAETITDCKARISLGCNNGKLAIHEFVEKNNHSLQTSETTHMFASHRKITEVQAHEIDLADDSRLRQKSTFQLMSTHAGHRANVGFTRVDVKNYIKAKRQRSMEYGDAGCLSQYFQRQLLENPSFFHAYQMDIEEQITNMFWCDANMILDYGYFGDVVSLDTTYCTNHANRPLALFCGFNHYRGSIIVGASLLYDETIESFRWLFETFLQAHNNKKPKTVFTDHDQAMARALADVMPETRHGLCTGNLLQNGIKHLGNLMKGGSYLLRDLKKCMYDIDIEGDFETTWINLVNDYNVHENNWIKLVYGLKKKWTSCYMKETLTLGMRSTQIIESLNAHFKSCMKLNVDIIQFFKHFERVVEEKRGNELRCDYESSHKLTRQFLALSISERNESQNLCEYSICMENQERYRRVSFDRASSSIICSCRKFETFGILCSRALKVLEANDVKSIPQEYILRRWTRQARYGVMQDSKGKEVEVDPKLSRTQMFRQVVSKFIKVAASCELEDLKIVDDTVDLMLKQIIERRSQVKHNDNHNNENPAFPSSNVTQPKGFKKQNRLKGQSQKRIKGWVEKQPIAKKKGSS